MNFLEGFRRLFTIFSLLVIAAAGFLAWIDNRAPPGCVEESTIKWEPVADTSKMSDQELFESLRKADAGGDSARARELARAIEERGSPSTKSQSSTAGTVRPLILCPAKAQVLAKQAGFAAATTAATAAILFVIWLALRWIIIGFFPAAVHKP